MRNASKKLRAVRAILALARDATLASYLPNCRRNKSLSGRRPTSKGAFRLLAVERNRRLKNYLSPETAKKKRKTQPETTIYDHLKKVTIIGNTRKKNAG